MSLLRNLLIAALLSLFAFAANAETVNINTATAQELAAALDGVGSAKAAAIVAYRDEHGRFQAVEDLTKVSGIGDKLMEANRSLLRLDEPAAVE